MLRNLTATRMTLGVIAAGITFIASNPVMAAGSGITEGSHTRAHSTRCTYGIAQDGSNNCMSRAEFEITRSRQAALDADPAQYLRNALARCEGVKGVDQQDCVSRIKGAGTTSGSVEGGGIYRELLTVIPGKPAEPAPEAGAAAGPAQ